MLVAGLPIHLHPFTVVVTASVPVFSPFSIVGGFAVTTAAGMRPSVLERLSVVLACWYIPLVEPACWLLLQESIQQALLDSAGLNDLTGFNDSAGTGFNNSAAITKKLWLSYFSDNFRFVTI